MSIRIVLIDSQELVRCGLRAILEAAPDLEIAGEASEAAEAVDQLDSTEPDVFLINVTVPDEEAAQAVRCLTSRAGDTPACVLVLASYMPEDSTAVLDAGASGLFFKNAGPLELVAAVRVLAAGYQFLPSPMIHHLANRAASRPNRASRHIGELERLSNREHEVLRLLVQGWSNAKIAGTLHLSEATVKSHVQRILGKLGLHDRVQAVIYAYEAGLVTPGSMVNPVALPTV
jgi:DNA-binding NarL/FixJ family response regulator